MTFRLLPRVGFEGVAPPTPARISSVGPLRQATFTGALGEQLRPVAFRVRPKINEMRWGDGSHQLTCDLRIGEGANGPTRLVAVL